MAGLAVWLSLGALLALYLLRQKPDARLKQIPIIRYSDFLPDLLNRFIFYPKAKPMIYWGYENFKNDPFRMLTGDGEIVVLPIKYMEELKYLPPSIISSLDAQFEVYSLLSIHDLKCTGGIHQHQGQHSYVPSNTVRKRLTPSIARITPWIIDELRHAFETVLPDCEDQWITIKAHEMCVGLISRATSRVLAHSLRRNEQWLDIASNYSVNVGITILLLRPFPNFLRPFIAPFLPSIRQMKKQLQFAKKLFIPMISERRAAEAANDPGYVKPDDFLQWMMDMADNEQDLDPEALAHHSLILMSLAVVHMSSIALCQILYDLIARPEYIEPLREEIIQTLSNGWDYATKASFNAQKRMDSFLRESQRWGPPGELSMHRIVKTPLTLSDGLHLPEGVHICFPSGPISKDPNFILNPDIFDGFRWCQDPGDRDALRQSSIALNSNAEMDKEEQNGTLLPAPSPITSFISISPSSMHFGFGRQACPGWFLAASTIKAIMSRIIMDYEFKFEGDRVGWRPANIGIGEHIVPNTNTRVLFRKRQK